MSPEAQRIAIAGVCGWRNNGHVSWWHPVYGQKTAQGWDTERVLPDYLNDLNAMHEAEEIFATNKLGPQYQAHLDEINTRNLDFGVYHSNARERAEAFLRTMGLWDDSK